MLNHLINHIVFVVDRSTSIRDYRLENTIIQVFDNQIKWLAKRSEELSQETRVSVYLFGAKIECVVWDIDVLRLPSLKEVYKVKGNTRLVDATIQAIQELGETPERYGDHSFLVYVLTDGEENASSRFNIDKLPNLINSLPENWTFATYVPNHRAVEQARLHGFPEDNIDIWSTTQEGLKDVGQRMQKATETYFQARSKGIRGSKSLFKLDLSKLTTSVVARNLQHLAPWDYTIYMVGDYDDDMRIKEFVERYTGTPYKIKNHHGPAFYELLKSEIVQPQKRVLIRDKQTDKVYGGDDARRLLGLPSEQIRLKPEDTSKYDIFIESTSYTRKLPAASKVLVLQPIAKV